MQSNSNINAYIRIKPSNKKEKLSDLLSWTKETVILSNKITAEKSFQFNQVFDPSTSQEEIFARIVLPAIDSCLEGYNWFKGFVVKISFIELFNEELVDLLSNESNKLYIYDDTINKGAVIVKGVKEIEISSLDEFRCLFKLGVSKRTTCSTALNERSRFFDMML
ncbi:kinesin-like protein KLP2 [Octopus sinensis]|uniref:Kinesin-like protein KLP2 n=1 Tax=Octopus sinensis TaxID=2607531 RepID=A0A6P7TU89_9MOLL|nr:kinesin-like protein KLP2 [Octopus sinensis]